MEALPRGGKTACCSSEAGADCAGGERVWGVMGLRGDRKEEQKLPVMEQRQAVLMLALPAETLHLGVTRRTLLCASALLLGTAYLSKLTEKNQRQLQGTVIHFGV